MILIFYVIVHTMEGFFEEEITMLVAAFALIIQICNIVVISNVFVEGYYCTSTRNRRC